MELHARTEQHPPRLPRPKRHPHPRRTSYIHGPVIRSERAGPAVHLSLIHI